MEDKENLVLPDQVRENLEKDKETAFTLYLDFVIDGSASMYSVYPAVYFAALHFLESLARYEVAASLATALRQEMPSEVQLTGCQGIFPTITNAGGASTPCPP